MSIISFFKIYSTLKEKTKKEENNPIYKTFEYHE